MSNRLATCVAIVLLTASCEQKSAPPSTPVPTPPGERRDRPNGGITVEGEGLTPQAQETLANWAKHVLGDALRELIDDGIRNFERKLGLVDDVERQLFVALGKLEPGVDTDAWDIYLIRPSNTPHEPETIELVIDGRPVVRFMRAFGGAQTPVAFLTVARRKDGRTAKVDWFLTYGPDGKWVAKKSPDRTENLQPAGR